MSKQRLLMSGASAIVLLTLSTAALAADPAPDTTDMVDEVIVKARDKAGLLEK